MGCTWMRKQPGDKVPPNVPNQIEVAGAPTVTTYQNNEGSYVLGANQMQSSAVLPVPSPYNNSPIRPGESTNNQFLSTDILGAQSKIVPPQPPSYSPTPPPSQPPIYSSGSMPPNIVVQPPPMTPPYNTSMGRSGQFSMPVGPSTQDYY